LSGYSTKISRVTRTRAQAKSAYNKMSRWYDLMAGNAEQKISDIGLKMLDVKPAEKVLEIGCGTGNSIVNIARYVGESGKAYGLDISTGMLNITRAKVNKHDLSPRVDLTLGDATALPYNDGTLDSILMSFTLELFDTPEIPVVLDECRRVLRANGRICVVAMSKKGKGIAISLYEWSHRIYPSYVDCRPILLTEALEDSAFRIVESRTVKMWGLPVEIALAKR
jgi:ubiquinone/menaquinone biosynthesis C-methylase UbiE